MTITKEQTKYTLAIAEPEASARNRFRESTRPVVQFGEVIQCAQMSELISRLETGSRVDIIFLSSKFDQESVQTFIKKAGKTKHGELSCFVQIVDGNKTGSSMASNMIAGADGFLMEPFSVESLVNIANLATKVKKDKSMARERAALGIILNDIVAQLDRIAFIKSCKP